MVDFEWYRSFIAIYKHHSVSEAAKTRMMTQPAMSQHLAALEAEVGEALFTRVSRRLVVTERGKELYSRVAPLVESLEETTAALKSTSLPNNKVFRIGLSLEYFQELLLPKVANSGMCSVSYFGTADQLLELLKEDQVELIITPKKFIVPGIEYELLMEETFTIITPASLEIPELRHPKEIEEWLSGQRWISYGLELPIIRRLWREHFKRRPLIKPKHVIPNLHAVIRAVEMGAGISVIPTYLLDNSKADIHTCFDNLTVTNDLLIGYKSKHKHLPELQEIISIIRRDERT
ncbi:MULTISPECIES: LysR family transcriptional regulator [unclassified Paenibacillus]|uniref:LysR family transcriptional regulator n=1 Tax=unclassified Paenibacillus TaxID=185978 RepID=UPI0010510626|nr:MULTISPECIES: LysR family transcriptional regulator [unclassified Paenibacillus]NIK70385.1 DNA-binding transcriptional LysR family regulator [Paenibacillus sp. BK720]TCM90690.1 DNA-binding transcriptional LysR family regulator [Paenibacillus sp. BK033]